MAEPTLAVLLRNGTHTSASVRYALKCNDVAMSYAKTPIQIPIAQQSPELIDLGYFRPSITCTGIIDTIGGNTSNTTVGFAGMESFTYVRQLASDANYFSDGGTSDTAAQTYYIPYKNALEEAAATWMYLDSTPLQIEIGDAKYPIDSYGGYMSGGNATNRFHAVSGNRNVHATGGAIYEVAIQQCRFSLKAATEDRYEFTMQFVAKARLDMPVSA
jgi:hypothetical protein